MAGVSSSSPYATTPTVTGTVQPTLGGSTAITTSASAPVAETAPPQPADTTTNTTSLQDKKVKEEKDDNQSKLDQLTNMVSTLSGFAPGFTELQAVGNILGELRKRGPEVGKQAARGMTSKQFDDWTRQIAKDHGLVRKPALLGPGREPMAPGTPASPPSASAPYVQEERGTSGQRRSTSGDTSQTVRDASITSPAARAFLDTVADKESGGQYNVSYGGGHFQDYSAHPGSSSVITSGPNQGRTSSAAGRYQFTQSTWQEASKALGLKDFSPESQDKAAWWLAQRDYNKLTHRDLSGDINSTDPQVRANIASTLKKTWTSLPGGIEAGGNLADFNTRFDQHLKQEAAANEDRKDGQGQVTASLEGPRAPGSAADILRQRSERPADLPAGVQAASADPGFVPTINGSSGAMAQDAGSFQTPLGAGSAMSAGGYPQMMSPMAKGIGGAISGVFGNILGQGAGVVSQLMSGVMARGVDSLPQAIRPFAGSMMDSAQRDTGLFPSRIAGEVSGEVGNLIGMATGHPQAPLRTGSPMAGGFPGLTMPSPQGIMGMIGGMVGGVLNRGAGMLSQAVSGLVGRGTGHLPSMLRPMAGSAVSSVEHGIGGAISGAVQGTINTVMGYSPRRVGESTWHTLDPRAASGDPERGRGPTHVPTRAEAERVQRNIEHGMGLRHTPTHAEAEHVAANINRGMGLDRAAVPSISGRSAPAPGRMDTTSPGVPTTPPTANEASSMSMISAISQGAGSGQNGGQSGDAGLTGASPALSGSAASLMDMSTAFAPDETQLFALQRLG